MTMPDPMFTQLDPDRKGPPGGENDLRQGMPRGRPAGRVGRSAALAAAGIVAAIALILVGAALMT